MTEAIKLDLDAIESAAKAATPQDFDSGEVVSTDGWAECPCCAGEGSVELTADYLNYDGEAVGVQFYGVGSAYANAETFYRAAKPAVVLKLIRCLRAAEAVIHARIAQVPKDAAVVALIGDFTHEHVDLLKGFHNALRAQHNPIALVMCLQSPADIEVLDADQMRKVGWVRTPEPEQS